MAFIAPILPALAVGAQVAGTAVTAIAKSNADSYRAQVANNNANIAEQNADRAIKAGLVKAGNESLKGAAIGGKIKAAQAASGIDVNSGSAVDVQTGEREVNKLDSETVLSNAQLEGYGYRSQATNYEAQAHLSENASQYDLVGGALGVTGDLLGGAQSLGTKWSTSSEDVPSLVDDPVG